MQKLLWAAALAALAAFPGAARADGIAFAGVENARVGTTSPDTGIHYATLMLPKQTVVTAIGPGGAVLNYGSLPGEFGIPMVAFDGSKAGLSHDGKTLVLAQPPIGRMRNVSRFPVLSTRRLRLTQTVVLKGSFSFDAVSPDGKTLYLIEHVNRQDVSQYRVRAYDLDARRLLPKPIRDPKTGEIMHGYPVSRAMSADGRWAYTLYQAPNHSFVHALDTVNRRAACIDLPADTPQDYVGDSRLVIAPHGDVTVNSRSGGVLAVIDTERHVLRPPVETPIPVEPENGPPWPGLAAGLAALLGAAVYLIRRRLRSVPAVVADQRRDKPGQGDAGADLGEKPILVTPFDPEHEPAYGYPDHPGQGGQEQEEDGDFVPWTPAPYPEHVVGNGRNGHHGSREEARERVAQNGGPNGDAHDRRRQPGREHQPA